MPNYNNNDVRNIQVARIPGTYTNVGVHAGDTVKTALAAAGITVGKDEVVRANGQTVNLTDSVNGYTSLTVTKNIKGNR